jgi:hypothetical protein
VQYVAKGMLEVIFQRGEETLPAFEESLRRYFTFCAEKHHMKNKTTKHNFIHYFVF